MNDITALDLYYLVIQGFHSSSNQINKLKDVGESHREICRQEHNQTCISHPNQAHQRHANKHWSYSSKYIGFWPSVMLYVFEDNEAVIKMIIKDRSPTMRHTSRSHKIRIQIRYIDSKYQRADILIQDNFPRDERNNLLHLFSISHFSSSYCAKNSSLISCPKAMTKRMKKQKEEERIVGKSKSTAMKLLQLNRKVTHENLGYS